MARWTLGFLLGVIILTGFSYLPPLQIAIGCIGISSAGLILLRRISSFWLTFFLASLLGFAWALLVAHHKLHHYLPAVLQGQTLIATGNIVSIPEHRPRQLRFDFLIKQIATQTAINYPLRVRLTLYHYKNAAKFPLLKNGDEWQFAIRLKRPRGFWNPGSFDYQAELLQKNIQATGYIVNHFSAHFIRPASFYYLIEQLRAKLLLHIKLALKNSLYRGLINALTTGIRYDISDSQWQVMRATGTNHLFAISGLHLAFIAGIIYYITRLCCRFIPQAMLAIPATQIAAVLTALFAIFYAALAGFALPVQRALLMLLVFLWANLLRRNLAFWHAWYCSLLIILVYSPFAVLSASFWLSFMAVAFILYAVVGRLQPVKGWRAWGRTQYNVGLGLIPFVLLFFQQISWISFAANLLAIPAIGFIILPLTLAGSFLSLFIPSWGDTLLVFTASLLELLWKVLTSLATLKWAHYTASIATPYLFIGSVLGLFILLAPQGFPGRYMGIIYLLPLFLWKAPGPKRGEIWFSLLDVGQGLATVIRTQHHTVVYDTGPSRPFDAGRAVLLPFLQKFNIGVLDMLMVSHGDDDHSGGAQSLLQQIPVVRIVSSMPNKFLPRIAEWCHEKINWQWDKVNFEILYPAINDAYLGNNSSCVLRISNASASILLTGDIEKAAENYLVHERGEHLASTILIVPHHGSKTSSSSEFLNKVQPSIALFSTGYRNQFKFPHPLVLKRYQQRKVLMYDTAMDGAITIKLNPISNTMQIDTFHQKYQRFWRN
jgi:competence protein ComEC